MRNSIGFASSEMLKVAGAGRDSSATDRTAEVDEQCREQTGQARPPRLDG